MRRLAWAVLRTETEKQRWQQLLRQQLTVGLSLALMGFVWCQPAAGGLASSGVDGALLRVVALLGVGGGPVPNAPSRRAEPADGEARAEPVDGEARE